MKHYIPELHFSPSKVHFKKPIKVLILYSKILLANTLPFKCDSDPLLTSRMKFIILFIEIHLDTQLFKIMKFLLIFFCQEEL